MYAPRPPKRRRGLSGVAIAAITLTGIFAVVCGIGFALKVLKPDEPSSALMPQSPAYRVVSEDRGYIFVEVDAMPDGDGLKVVFDHLRVKSRPDGGYFVRINCATGGTQAVDNRLANGKFAVGKLGAGKTGLEAGQYEFQVVADRKCPV